MGSLFFENTNKIDTHVVVRRGRGNRNQEWKRGHDLIEMPYRKNLIEMPLPSGI